MRSVAAIVLVVGLVCLAEFVVAKRSESDRIEAEAIRREADATKVATDALEAENAALEADNAALEAENAALDAKITALETENLRDRALVECRDYGDAAVLWGRMTGRTPQSLKDLAMPPRSGGKPLIRLEPDPWGGPYHLEHLDNAVRVVSAGPDRKMGTDDDLGCTVER